MPSPPEHPLRPAPPRRDNAAEEEAGRRLTNAHIHFRRGMSVEAEAATRALLANRPHDTGAWELLGDIQSARGEFAEAGASYQTAMAYEPGRASAEAKFGRMALRQAERARQEKLGVAYAASNTLLVRGGAEGRRGALWGALGSALCPGLGQIVGGQIEKGAVLVGVFLVSLALMALISHGFHPGQGGSYFSPGFWIIFAIMAADWVYAVADAALMAQPKE